MEAGGLGFIGQGLTTFTPGCTQLGVRTCVRSRPAVRRRSPGLEGLQCLQSERQSETDLFDFDINDFGGAEEGWSMEEDEGKENEKHDEKPKKTSGERLPIVAVIGRPNVGKSMLVNRLAASHRGGAIVHDVVGVTRDRTYRRAFWGGKEYVVVDTGGLIFRDDPKQVFIKEIRQQALIALHEASAVLFVTDGMAGVNPLDDQIAVFLRKECKAPVFVCVNKCESDIGEVQAAEFWSLGLGQPYAISAIHGTHTGDLLDDVCSNLPTVVEPVEDDAVNVAIVGRPNVGKSTLLNKLVNAERSIVSTLPGTTRDAVDELVERDGTMYRLIDTAGIRRKKGVEYGTEFFMINRAFNAIRRSDVALIVVDGLQEIADQDGKIAERIRDEGRAAVIICNKWDMVENKDNKSWSKMNDYIKESFPMVSWAPIVIISALTGQRTQNLYKVIDDAVAQHRRRVSTALLNEVLYEAYAWHKPPANKHGKQGKIYYCTQVAIRPPTIALFVNDPSLFKDNYRRYMEGQFRKALGFEGTPIRLVWRGKSRMPML